MSADDSTLTSRRALLAGTLGGIAALAATVIGGASRAQAAAGSALIIGNSANNAGTSNTLLTTNSSVVAFELIQNGPGTALMGYVTPASGGTRGVYGRSNSSNGDGVQARNAGAAGTGAGVRAFGGNNKAIVATTTGPLATAIDATVLSGAAIVGHGVNNGMEAYATLPGGNGMYAVASAGSGASWGVWGVTSSANGRGVFGQAVESTGVNFGVYGQTLSTTNGWAGYFQNNVFIGGTLVTAVLVSRVDNPASPTTDYLQHAPVESPEQLRIHSGTVTLDARGEATIALPSWYAAIHRDARYQLTAIGAAAPDLHVKSELNAKGEFTIAGGAAHGKVSWQVTGVRADPAALAQPMEPIKAKPAWEVGSYLNPELYGQPASKGANAHLIAEAVAKQEAASRGR